MRTSEELNKEAHPLYSMGSRRHYDERRSDDFVWRSHNRHVGPTDHTMDKNVGMQKIIENYVIVKPKVERIGGHDDF